MNKKNPDGERAAIECFHQKLIENHHIIENTICFWEDRMNDIIEEMNVAEEIPEWHPDKEDTYHKLNLEMQFVLKKLEADEQEIESLEEKTNRLLADKIFKKFKRIDGEKKD